MNKRIKELAEQARTREKGPTVLNGAYSYNSEIILFDKEKFAELIVRECANIADQEAKEQKNNHGKQAADRIWNTIMNRFRVEE